MKRLPMLLALLAVLGGDALAQSLPAAGLTAEGEERWEDALRLYRETLHHGTESAELWQRVANIEARLGRTRESIEALERAAAAAPSDPRIRSSLSQAYAAQGNVTSAVRAIERALALRPDEDEYLRAYASLATWAGEYKASAETYRRLRRAHPAEAELLLALARVTAWSGDADAAVGTYREYLERPGALPEAWLELARNESWRGNVRAALNVLDDYSTRFGETDAYVRERTAILARGGAPRAALRELDARRLVSPLDFDLTVSRAVALASTRQYGAARATLSHARALKPGGADIRATESVVRSMLGSTVGPTTTVYSDSDGLRATRVSPRFDLAFESDTRLHGGYEHAQLRARRASGLQQVSGATSASMEHVWAGLSQRLGRFTAGGSLGRARSEGHELTTYGAVVRFVPTDSFAASLERSSGFAGISPRAAGLGLSRVAHRAQVDWQSVSGHHLAVEGSHENLSDGNVRWEAYVAPRTAVIRSQRLNLDLGLLIHQFGASRDMDSGYYDPQRYQYYSVVASPYLKLSDNAGLGISAGVGGQRDETARGFRLGSNASVEATVGIYQRWLLKVHGSATRSRRLDSGAFGGVSGSVSLQRRF